MQIIKIFLILILSVVLNSYAKENSIKYTPSAPSGSEPITVYYNPTDSELNNSPNIEMRYFTYSMNCEKEYGIDEAISVDMDKEGNIWKAIIQPSILNDLIYVEFTSNEIVENNEGNGYFISIYDKNGNEKIGSRIGQALFCGGDLPYIYNLNVDEEKALRIMEKVFNNEPDLKLSYLRDYGALLISVRGKEEALKIFSEELEILGPRKDLMDETYFAMYTWYNMLKKDKKAEELKSFLIEKYPSGLSVFWFTFWDIRAEQNLEKQIEMAIKLYTDFPSMKKYDLVGFNVVIQTLLQQERYTELQDLLKSDYIKESAELLQVTAQYLLNEDKEIDFAISILEDVVELDRAELEKPLTEKDNFETERQNFKKRKNNLGFALLDYVNALSKQKIEEGANTSFEEAFSLIAPQDIPESRMEHYTNYLVSNTKFDEAKIIIEEAVKNSTATDKMKDNLKTIYYKKNGHEEGFDKYLVSLESFGKNKILEKLKSELIKEPAPNFSLKDVDGNVTRLSDLKGKIIILDFWATWCAPCIASFPAMQKAVDKYNVNKDIRFLFINSWEKGEDKPKKIKDFFDARDYSFKVLLDEDDSVITNYKVSGIPTKFLIDKDGFIRFNKVGSGASAEAIVEEISAMISLVQ